jgi:hypothetical protein
MAGNSLSNCGPCPPWDMRNKSRRCTRPRVRLSQQVSFYHLRDSIHPLQHRRLQQYRRWSQSKWKQSKSSMTFRWVGCRRLPLRPSWWDCNRGSDGIIARGHRGCQRIDATGGATASILHEKVGLLSSSHLLAHSLSLIPPTYNHWKHQCPKNCHGDIPRTHERCCPHHRKYATKCRSRKYL